MRRSRTDGEYKAIIKEINPNIINIEPYIANNKNILHKCLIDGYVWNPKPASIMSGTGCPVCATNVTATGFNDLWTTNPEIASLLVDNEYGYRITRNSHIKLDWKCSICNSITKNKEVSMVYKFGLNCSACSDKISIPNKFIANILNNLKIVYLTEHSFPWLDNRRYDVYIPTINCIIEMHGMQHFQTGWKNFKSLEEIQQIDKLKQDKAIANGITNYVVIDARFSELEFIKNKIENSELKYLINLSNVNWKECFVASQKSVLVLACEKWNEYGSMKQILEELNICRTSLLNYLKRGAKLGLCDYNPLDEFSRKVIQLDNFIVYDSITKAAENSGLSPAAIIYWCNRKGEASNYKHGKNKNRFMYYKDYLFECGGEKFA